MNYVLKMLTAIKIKKVQFRQRAEENRHHQIHEKAAWRSINQAIQVNGWKLTEENKRKADEYAVDVFGRKEYAPWLYFFTLFSGEFKEGWIPLNYYTKYILPDPSLSRISSVKTFSKTVLQTNALPDIGYYVNGRFYDREFLPIKISYLKKLVAKNFCSIFVKEDNSLRGMGIHVLGAEDITEENFQHIGNSVIQYPVRQHPFFEEFMPDSAANVRVITVRNLNGEIKHSVSYLKFGRQGKPFYQASLAVWVAIIDNAGFLDDHCYLNDFTKLSAHPDTGVKFSKKRIPRFSDCVSLCVSLHQNIPHFPIIGWDLSVDREEKIQIFEWNAGAPHPDIKTVQAAVGPCFSGLGWEDLWK